MSCQENCGAPPPLSLCPLLSLRSIRATAARDRIQWLYHALVRAGERGITHAHARQVIRDGRIVEQNPLAKPLPKCLMMAEISPGQPLYVSLAYDAADDFLYVITVHWYDPGKWEDPWTRKHQAP